MAQIKPSQVTGVNDEYAVVRVGINMDIKTNPYIEVVFEHSSLDQNNKPKIEYLQLYLSSQAKMLVEDPAWVGKPAGFNFNNSATWGTLKFSDIPKVESDLSEMAYASGLDNLYALIKSVCYKLAHIKGVIPGINEGYQIV